MAMVMFGSNEPGGGVTPFSLHQAPGSRWLRRGMPFDGSCCRGIGGSGITANLFRKLRSYGVGCVTLGDHAFRKADAPVLAPFGYSEIVTATVVTRPAFKSTARIAWFSVSAT